MRWRRRASADLDRALGQRTRPTADRERPRPAHPPLLAAGEVRRRAGGGRVAQRVEPADLVSYGIFGLIDAIERFEPERGTSSRRTPSPGSRAPSSTSCARWTGCPGRCGPRPASLEQALPGPRGPPEAGADRRRAGRRGRPRGGPAPDDPRPRSRSWAWRRSTRRSASASAAASRRRSATPWPTRADGPVGRRRDGRDPPASWPRASTALPERERSCSRSTTTRASRWPRSARCSSVTESRVQPDAHEGRDPPARPPRRRRPRPA